jgi:hypothetical protein
VSACAGKHKMATEQLAKERADSIMRHRSNGARRINYYQCRLCGCWHLTSWSQEKFQRISVENRRVANAQRRLSKAIRDWKLS